MTIVYETILAGIAFLSLIWLAFHLINGADNTYRDEIISGLRKREADLMIERDAARSSLDAVNLRLDAKREEVDDLRRRIDRVARILGFVDGEEDEPEDEDEDEEEDDATKIYAASVDCGAAGEHMALLVRARSPAECLGKIHLAAEKAYPGKEYTVTWTGDMEGET